MKTYIKKTIVKVVADKLAVIIDKEVQALANSTGETYSQYDVISESSAAGHPLVRHNPDDGYFYVITDYTDASIREAKAGIIPGRLKPLEIKDVVDSKTGNNDANSGQWHTYDQAIKDESITIGTPLVPVRIKAQWWWILNPSAEQISAWMTQTGRRLFTEVIRMLKAASLPQYRNTPEVKAIEPSLKVVRDAIDAFLKAGSAFENIDE